jgi:hypothetical protein
MSQFKPEIGDVWISNKGDDTKLFIINVMGKVYCVSEYGVISGKSHSDFGETGCFIYLGKSKVSIKELFDVEDAK